MRNKFLLILLVAGLLVFQSCTSEQVEPTPGPDEEMTEGNLTVTSFSTSIDENPANGTEIGKIAASTTSGTITYNLISQSSEGAIEVDSETGLIRVTDGSAFDATAYPQIVASVDVSDGSNTIETSIEINVYTIWSGTDVSFVKANGADPTNENNQDRITDNVWITRGNQGGQIYNVRTESSSDKSNSPEGTQWALGSTSQIHALTFDNFRDAVNPKSVVGKELVLYLVTEGIYIDITFDSWSQGRQGGFAYTRSTED